MQMQTKVENEAIIVMVMAVMMMIRARTEQTGRLTGSATAFPDLKLFCCVSSKTSSRRRPSAEVFNCANLLGCENDRANILLPNSTVMLDEK